MVLFATLIDRSFVFHVFVIILICSVLSAFFCGLLVSGFLYVAGDPNESLTRVAWTAGLVSALAGFGCGFFSVLLGSEETGSLAVGEALTALLVAGISALAAAPSFFIVFFVGEVIRQLREARSSRLLTPKFRRTFR
jgi:hypothetical protein